MTLAVFLAGFVGSALVLWLWPKRGETIEEQARRFVRENLERRDGDARAPAPSDPSTPPASR